MCTIWAAGSKESTVWNGKHSSLGKHSDLVKVYFCYVHVCLFLNCVLYTYQWQCKTRMVKGYKIGRDLCLVLVLKSTSLSQNLLLHLPCVNTDILFIYDRIVCVNICLFLNTLTGPLVYLTKTVSEFRDISLT